MKLILPDYDYMFEENMGEVKDGVLYIYRPNCFKKMMYALTYEIYGKECCYFCKRNFEKYRLDVTLDHLVPQEFGGPTITNNMRPTCHTCNGRKDNLYVQEFDRVLNNKFMNDVEKREFYAELSEKQEKRRKGEIASLPKSWISTEDIRTVYVNVSILEPLGVNYRKQERFYNRYKKLPKPVVLSSNKFLLDGFNTIMLAKNMHEDKISVIVLDNVVYVGFPNKY